MGRLLGKNGTGVMSGILLVWKGRARIKIFVYFV